MNSLLLPVFLLCCASLTLAASLYQSAEQPLSNLAKTKLQSLYEDGDDSSESRGINNAGDITYLHWLKYALANHKYKPNTESKRFTSFSMPYYKYQAGKRNNGVWIWMPAQGYVSVPKQQQEAFLAEDGSGKPGKIMRYGK